MEFLNHLGNHHGVTVDQDGTVLCDVNFALEKLGTHGNGLDIHAGGNDLKFPHQK